MRTEEDDNSKGRCQSGSKSEMITIIGEGRLSRFIRIEFIKL
jgi:hypothetical protein